MPRAIIECGLLGDRLRPAIGYGALGSIAGATTTVIVDAALLARELVHAPARDHAMFLFTPMRSGGGLTVVGRF